MSSPLYEIKAKVLAEEIWDGKYSLDRLHLFYADTPGTVLTPRGIKSIEVGAPTFDSENEYWAHGVDESTTIRKDIKYEGTINMYPGVYGTFLRNVRNLKNFGIGEGKHVGMDLKTPDKAFGVMELIQRAEGNQSIYQSTLYFDSHLKDVAFSLPDGEYDVAVPCYSKRRAWVLYPGVALHVANIVGDGLTDTYALGVTALDILPVTEDADRDLPDDKSFFCKKLDSSGLYTTVLDGWEISSDGANIVFDENKEATDKYVVGVAYNTLA